MKKILFVCVENAGRSQLAEAFAKYYGKDKAEVISAGTKPAKHVSSVVAAAMKEKGIDISKNQPRLLNSKIVKEADVIVTMGCSVEKDWPAPMLKKAVNWCLDDPKGKPIEEIGKIRDEIERRVLQLLRGVSFQVRG